MHDVSMQVGQYIGMKIWDSKNSTRRQHTRKLSENSRRNISMIKSIK